MQRRIIGSIIFFLSSFTLLLASEKVTLRLTDTNGTALNKIAVGTPFLIEITSEQQLSSQNIQFNTAGLAILNQGSSSTVRMINAQVQRHYAYHYTARIDTVGTFTIGPATITLQGHTITTQKASLEVIPKKPGTSHQDSSLQLMLQTERTHCVVDEQVPCTLRCTFSDDVTIRSFQVPSSDIFHITLDDKPQQSIEHHGEQRLITLTWQGFLYPKKIGAHAAAIVMLYNVTRPQRGNNFWNTFLSGFQPVEEHQISSNKVQMTIAPLPTSEKPICGVGIFTHATAALQQTTLEQNKATVLTITLYGTGNFEALKAPSLTLPDFCKCYPSKILPTKPGQKSFEYVIQATEPGSWEIPPQEITYFDTAARCCKTLLTPMLPLTITQAPTQVLAQHLVTENEPSSPESAAANTVRPPLLRTLFIHDNLLIILIALPLLLQLGRLLYFYSNRRWQLKERLYWQYVLYRARRQLKTAKKLRQPDQVYDIFMQLSMHDTTEIMPTTLSETEMPQWHHFWHQTLHHKFGTDASVDENFFATAAQWLPRMEKNI